MEKYFYANYMDQRIMIPKRNVDFENGFGKVGAFVYLYSIDGDLLMMPILGVVDKNFNVVLDYKFASFYSNINFLPGGSILYVIDVNEDFYAHNYNVALRKPNGEVKYLDASDYKIVDDELIVLECEVGGRKRYCLSNVAMEETADNLYDYIGDFVYKEEFGCEVAEVGIFVAEGSDSVNFEVLTFFINKNDEQVSSYVFNGQVFDNMPLVEVMALINRSRI